MDTAAFTDDSSSALGLDHRAVNDLTPFKGGGIEKWDAVQRAVIDAAVREKIDRRVASLVKDGCTIKQARELATEEHLNPKVLKPIEDRGDRRVKALETLMDVNKKPAKHGGSKSKRRVTAKSGKPICLNCGLEADACWCICANGGQLCAPCDSFRKHQAKRGRPPAGKRSRNVRVRGSVSKPVSEALKGLGVSVGEIVETVVDHAIRSGLHPCQVVEQLQP